MPFVSGGGGGGLSLSGGTLSPAAGNTALTIQAPAGSQGAQTDELVVLDEFANFLLESDAAGNFIWKTMVAGTSFLVIDHSNNNLLQAKDGVGVTALRSLNVLTSAGVPLFTVLPGGGIRTNALAPATTVLVSGAAAQIDATTDFRTFTPVTFNPTAGAAATCKVEVSPDNVTYTTLWTETEPAGIALDGTIHGIAVYLPAAWRIKLTVTNATLGTTTYY